MDETVCALFYKKYSLNAVKLQILSLLSLILLSCILSLIKFKINDNYVVLSMNQILIIASYLFMIGGLINGSTEVDNPESKIIYLLSGNKNISAQKIIIVELIDCVLQVILSFLIIVLFLLFKGEIKGIDLIVLISYILSTTLCSSIAYFLARATLLIFPILVLPYIERVLPATSPYIYYEAISESFKTSVFSTSHIVLLFWNVMVLLLIYLKIKKGFNNG